MYIEMPYVSSSSSFSYDLLMMCSIMDGITACKEIRRLQKAGSITCHVPIISVSTNARNEQVGSARDAGMDDSISKPFRIRELLPKIEVLAKTWK